MKFTPILLQRTLSQMVDSINWLRASGRYVLRDPSNKDLLLYLDEKHYHKLVITAMSADITLEVLATPDDTADSIKTRLHLQSTVPKGTPPLDSWLTWNAKLFPLISGWKVKDSMIEFERNFKSFIPKYYRNILSWFGSSYSQKGKKEIRRYSRFMNRILETRKVNQVITILKIHTIVILQYVSGNPLKTTQELGQRIKLIHGLPASLPLYFRSLIRANNIKFIRIILTLTQSYKGIRGTYKDASFDTITSPYFDKPSFERRFQSSKYNPFPFSLSIREESWREVIGTVKQFSRDFNFKNLPFYLLTSSKKPPFTLTASPSHSVSFVGSLWDALVNFILDEHLKEYNHLAREFETKMNYITPLDNLQTPYEYMDELAVQFYTELSSAETISIKYLQTFSWYKRLLDNYPNLAEIAKNKDEILVQDLMLKFVPEIPRGRLALKYEAAGKVRVFALSDYWTQWVLKPLHETILNILKMHPCDATFDQEGKVKEFQDKKLPFLASFDLKAATDLIPIDLHIHVLTAFTSREIAEKWKQILVDRDYIFYETDSQGNPSMKTLRYSRGQPMGSLSSWAMLALVHHYLVWLAAYRKGYVQFTDYLVLGDDIVIGNEEVAFSYKEVCSDYGITIGFPKSFISKKGLFQFASQDCYGEYNISPVSLKEVLSISGYSYYFGKDFNLSKLVEFLRRAMRKGFIGADNTTDWMRFASTSDQWIRHSKLLTKGIIPFELSNLLTAILLKDANLFNSISSLDRLIASLRGDIRLLTGGLEYDMSFRHNFVLLIRKELLSRIKSTFAKIEEIDIQSIHPDLHDSMWYHYQKSIFQYINDRGDTLYTGSNMIRYIEESIKREDSMTPFEFDFHKPDKDEVEKRYLEQLKVLTEIDTRLSSHLTELTLIKETMNTISSKPPRRILFYLSLISQLEYKKGKTNLQHGC